MTPRPQTARADSGTAFGSTQSNSFGYNARSEVTSADMGNDTYRYGFDQIGNRLAFTNNTVSVSYTPNQLNQYTDIDSQSADYAADPVHDMDGNMTDYQDWDYSWNAENRMVVAEDGATKVENVYDSQGRRVEKKVYSWDAGTSAWVLDETLTYVWDGYNILAEYSDEGWTHYYTWGLDLSGTLQGAGGVGGLLAMTRDTGSSTDTYLYGFDGNGNVVHLQDASDASIVATYQYSPFGQVTSATGSMAATNTLRWSTKPTDDETGLVNYELRDYSPRMGRWPSRDPLTSPDPWLWGSTTNAHPGSRVERH